MSSIWTVRRSVSDRKLSGLAGGIARVWNVDPVLVRIAFGILALSGGIGVVLYLSGWLMIPAEDRETSVLDDAIPQTRGWARELRIGIVVVACLIGVAALSSVAPFGFAAAVVMAAVWYFGYYRNRPQRSEQPAPIDRPEPMRFAEFSGEPTPFTEAAKAWQQRIMEFQQTQIREQDARAWAEHERSRRAPGPQYAYSPTSSTPAGPVAPPPDPRHEAFLAHPDPVGLYTEPAPDESAIKLAAERRLQRKRSARRLGLVSLIVLGLTISSMAVASSVFGIAIPTATYLAAALLVVGVTLLAGARFGRPPGMAFLAVLLSLATALGVAARYSNNLSGADLGVRTVSYADAATMRASDHQRRGQLTVDLSKLRGTGDRHYSYTATVDQGILTVLPPDNTNARIEYRVTEGMVDLPGERADRFGNNLTGAVTAPGSSADKPTITLDLRVRQGQLEVR
ncbi:PspC domain-containing protein [Microlunatus soli]|uniref:Phage shock protein PspC (Stress-responsive transcriptional regulator) n=1 Tax=Microlunatus soli TaxID=630515 RepID=A0A1H1WZ31_9ACTN|nr:PspC domain-containing protein [Microlunatus soli]SDT02388.1 Phage shock protein PspC (stress-responsive transcriptional regulator) [Microlunatus soli]